MSGQQNCLLLSQVHSGMVTGLMVIDVDLGLIFKDTLLDLGLGLSLLIFKVGVLDLVIWALGKRSEL